VPDIIWWCFPRYPWFYKTFHDVQKGFKDLLNISISFRYYPRFSEVLWDVIIFLFNIYRFTLYSQNSRSYPVFPKGPIYPKVSEFPEKVTDISQFSKGFQRFPMSSKGFQCLPMNFDVFWWGSMGLDGFDGFRWASIGFRWVSMGFDGFRWISMDFDGFRWFPIVCEGFSRYYHILNIYTIM